MCRIGLHRCEYPCDPILVQTQKRGPAPFWCRCGAIRAIQNVRLRLHCTQIACDLQLMRCVSFANHMRYTAPHICETGLT
ncbi:unnamed protein product, partial [Staurois parvus]